MPGLNYRLIVPPTIEPVSLSLAKKQCRVDIPDEDYLIQTYIEIARDYCESYCNVAFYTQTWQLWLDSFPYGDYRSTVPIEQRNPWDYTAYWSDLAIRLPKPLALSVQKINYLDGDAQSQVLLPTTNFNVDLNSRPARITPLAGATWPITQVYQPGSINVIYTAGMYVSTITETVVVQGTGAPFTGALAHQVISITSVTDNTDAKTPLSYTAALVNDTNGDATSKTQLAFAAAPPSNVAVVTYQAGIIPKSIIAAMLLTIGHLYEHREENSEVALKSLPMGVESFLKRYVYTSFGNYRTGY